MDDDEGGEGEGAGEGDGDVHGGATDAERSSQVPGVRWVPEYNMWEAYKLEGGKFIYLGHHATAEAAAQAIDKYIKDGVVPAKRRAGPPQLKAGACTVHFSAQAAPPLYHKNIP